MSDQRTPGRAARGPSGVMARRPKVFVAAVVGLIGLAALAVWLTARETPLATDQVQLVVRHVEEAPRVDPFAEVWEDVPKLEAAMIPQTTTTPMLFEATVPAVEVRAVHDGGWISFLLEWEDPTANWYASGNEEFADAAAIQFPLAEATPVITMGAAGEPVNIWHWKADWQWDLDEHFRDVVDVHPHFFIDQYPAVSVARGNEPPFRYPDDFDTQDTRLYSPGWRAGNLRSLPERTSPVEDTVAVGFGTLEPRSAQPVTGRGHWEDGRWRVVFSRPLDTGDPEARRFRPGETLEVAFAVWDGTDQQRGGRKQNSSFYTILVEEG